MDRAIATFHPHRVVSLEFGRVARASRVDAATAHSVAQAQDKHPATQQAKRQAAPAG